MPIISQFYGILISLYYNEKEKHKLSHLHVRYNEYKASYDFDANLLEGKLPMKQSKMVEAWIMIHKEELMTLWKLINDEGKFFKIEPLK